MYLTEYQKVSVDNFMGYWNRGSLDDVPPDHASDILNMAFARKREVITRPSASFSHALPNGQNITRMFDATFNNIGTDLKPLALDQQGNIWRLDNYTVLMSIPGMIDFVALNFNNHCYIAPVMDGSNFNPDFQVIYVWESPSVAPRRAAGSGPAIRPVSVVGVGAGTGNAGPGYYGVAICYIFDTGYVSPPSAVTVSSPAVPAGSSINVLGIFGSSTPPPPPPGVVGFMVLVTKAQASQTDAYRAPLYEYGTFDDPNLVNVTLNFFDTDLTILASDDPVNGNLFNSMPRLPTGFGGGSIGLVKYHNRMVIIGPNLIYPPNYIPGSSGDTNYQVAKDGRIFISTAGAPENFDTLDGFLVVDAEFDGNIPRTGFELFGVLYICKAVGTYAAQDNGSAPSDATNPWTVNKIDGGIGAYHNAVGTITGSQPSLSFNSTAFLANRSGLFLFNGNVLRPELSWKIRALWAQMTINAEWQIRVTIDIYNDIFYVLFPVTNPNLPPLLVLECDYSLGLDSNNVRWSIYEFPWGVYDIMMAAFNDPAGLSYYYLRLGSTGIMYKLDGANLWDEVWVSAMNGGQANHVRNNPIENYYQSAAFILGDVGSLNIARFIRYRMAGQGTLLTSLIDQGGTEITQFANATPDPYPGNYRDLGIQTNFTNEKVMVKFLMNGMQDYMRMARVDVFGKQRWPTRPNG